MNLRLALKILAIPLVILAVAICLPVALAVSILFEDRGSDVEPRP